MGGRSSRSGTLLIAGGSGDDNLPLRQKLEAARFRVLNDSELGCDSVRAILVWLREQDGWRARVQQLRARYPDAVLLGLLDSGGDDARTLLEALRIGVADAVFADGTLHDLIPALRLGLERMRLDREADEQSAAFARELGRRARKLRRAFDGLEEAYHETLNALVAALDVREKATAGHSIRVAYYTCWLARRIGLGDSVLHDVFRGALLHDIGKIGIPDAILLKPAKLDDAEFAVMKTHAEIGKSFVERVSHLRRAIDIPWCHHEKWNGAGYPRGLAGEAIPLSARIFAVCDVYDALVSKRCYKDAMSQQAAFDILAADSGSHFDPVIVEAFLAEDPAVWIELDLASRSEDYRFAAMLGLFDRLAAPELARSGR